MRQLTRIRRILWIWEQGREYGRSKVRINEHLSLGFDRLLLALAADDYPSAQVIGLDLSPIQPDVVPPNVTFIVDDIEDEWLNGDNFDLVHLRHVMPYLESPEKVLKKAFWYVLRCFLKRALRRLLTYCCFTYNWIVT